MLVASLYNPDVATLSPEETLGRVLCLMPGVRSRLLYITDADSKLLGVVSSFDLLKLMLPDYLDANLARSVAGGDSLIRTSFQEHAATKISAIMTSALVTCAPEDTVVAVNALIREKGVNVLPVVDNQGRLLGEVTRRDILGSVAKLCCS